ncbi:hypothetical protein [Rhodococcus sp. B50]|uniref:hypothetical protein n=1 Tax=Rhodococcus sp. B50 TaxID=2682847 RepID=UPI001BD695FE|nr:hypothetical protein [Rhodococcus sp. B50]MBS9371563.1 hypothetical protein [Rhodococcus sp. B50]
MRIEEVIGRRIQELRKAQPGIGEMTQEGLGALLAPLLGKPWSRQAVSAAEAGKRAFTAVEVVALATVLGTTIDDLFDLRRQTEVVMPSGASLRMFDLEKLQPADTDSNVVREDLARLLGLLRDFTEATRSIQVHAAQAMDISLHVQDKVPDIIRYLELEGEA